jgi:long-chain acyl-CoA synthetase
LGILEAVERHRATVLQGVPSMYLAMLNIADIDRFDLESLRLCAVGGQSMAVNKMEEIEARLRAPLLELWGMTEIAGLGTTHPYNGPRNLGSIGIPLLFTEIRVVDPNDISRDMPTGEVGELLVRGPHVMEGYFKRPRDTELIITPNGWLHSGDLVRRDKRGYLYVVDRIKDVILSGGYTVYPAEVERVISQCSGVLAAVAVPIADELRGEIIKALVVLRPGCICSAEDVIAHCRDQLAPYKVPRAVEFVSRLPTGSTGKIIRRAPSQAPGSVTQLDFTRKLL